MSYMVGVMVATPTDNRVLSGVCADMACKVAVVTPETFSLSAALQKGCSKPAACSRPCAPTNRGLYVHPDSSPASVVVLQQEAAAAAGRVGVVSRAESVQLVLPATLAAAGVWCAGSPRSSSTC